MRFVLASASPARLQTLRAAGVAPIVHVSGVDESAATEDDPETLACLLARLKGEAVCAEIGTREDAVLVACDSVLAMDGVAHGKPGSDDAVRARWRRMRNHEGTLITGHHVIAIRGGRTERRTRAASTLVRFADITDAELDAYVASGEPQQVAGAFTVDGLGSAFVTGLDGDPHNVVGISVPLLRVMFAELGLDWVSFWAHG